MANTVFYSWQSDLPTRTNRNLIERALRSAATTVGRNAAINAAERRTFRVDRDTKGVPGAPDIATTILEKVSAAAVFVGDVSIVHRPTSGRRTPNPNVLIELGYAMKALGHERVILVFNEAFGSVDDLPFDLRGKRVLVYKATAAAATLAQERRDLTETLQVALRAALAFLPKPTGPRETIEERASRLRRESEDDSRRERFLADHWMELSLTHARGAIAAVVRLARDTLRLSANEYPDAANVHAGSCRLWIGWQCPPDFMRTVGDGRLVVELFGKDADKTIASRTYRFTATTGTHEPRWAPESGRTLALLTEGALAEEVLGFLLDRMETDLDRRR